MTRAKSDDLGEERPCLVFDIGGTLADIWPIERAVLVSMLGPGHGARLDQLHSEQSDLYALYATAIAASARPERVFWAQYEAACKELLSIGTLPDPEPLPSADFVREHSAQYRFVYATGCFLCEARHVLRALGLLDIFDEAGSTARDALDPSERRVSKSSGVPLAWIQTNHPGCILVTDSREDRRGAEVVGMPVVMVGAAAGLSTDRLALARVAKVGTPRNASAPRVTVIRSPRFGTYEQLVGERDDVGYQPLAGQGDGRYGWNMPPDFATDDLLARARGRILEIGCGDGSRVVMPSLRAGAAEVIALDINPDLLAHLCARTERAGTRDRLSTLIVPEHWWDSPEWLERVTRSVGTVDLVVARQVLQFGTVDSFVNVLRLANDVLSPTGELWMQNMSPYLQYLFELPWGANHSPAEPGAMIDEICARNAAVEHAAGRCENPRPRGSGEASPWVPLVATFDDFLWFDDALVRGALKFSERPLVLKESYCFSPAQIWVRNKLVDGRDDWREKELHVAIVGHEPQPPPRQRVM